MPCSVQELTALVFLILEIPYLIAGNRRLIKDALLKKDPRSLYPPVHDKWEEKFSWKYLGMGCGHLENVIRDFLRHMKMWTYLIFLFPIDYFSSYSLKQVDPILFIFASREQGVKEQK